MYHFGLVGVTTVTENGRHRTKTLNLTNRIFDFFSLTDQVAWCDMWAIIPTELIDNVRVFFSHRMMLDIIIPYWKRAWRFLRISPFSHVFLHQPSWHGKQEELKTKDATIITASNVIGVVDSSLCYIFFLVADESHKCKTFTLQPLRLKFKYS